MDDKQDMALERYDFQIYGKHRSRGALLLDTDLGPLMLRERYRLTSHFDLENAVKDRLRDTGMLNIDYAIPNKDGELVTKWDTGEKYVVYRWFCGGECDYRDEAMLSRMAGNLGDIHHSLTDFPQITDYNPIPLHLQYAKHNREMRRVYRHMKDKKRKTIFELRAMQQFHMFYHKAEDVTAMLEDNPYYKKKASCTVDICHGEYNYHNLIATESGLATTHFEHAYPGIQLMDVAYFMRKTMEKNHWQLDKGKAIWEGYAKRSDCGTEALAFLYIVLSYPIKYWKLLNQYMNGKKTWISDKSIEKLRTVYDQEEAKTVFLEKLTSF